MSSISEDEAFIEVIWKIENFSCSWHAPGEYFETNALAFHLKNGPPDWTLRLFPKGVSSSKAQWLSVMLFRKYDNHTSKWGFKTEFSLLDATNRPKHSKQVENEISQSGSQSGIELFVLQKGIFNNKDIYLPQDVLTLRCRLTYKGIVHAQNISATTTVIMLRSSAMWKITDFENCNSSSHVVTFPVCDRIFNQPTELILTYKNTKGDEWIQFFMENANYYNLYLRSRIVLPEIDELYVLNEKCLTASNWYIKPFISQKNLIQRLKQLYFNGILQAACEFTVVSNYPESKVTCGDPFLKIKSPLAESLRENAMEHINFLTADLQQLYKTGMCSDLRLEVQTESYRVHASIMAARSPVFLRILESDMAEKESRTIVIDDLEPETCSRMLDYFYSADLGALDVPMSRKLYYAGDKYQVHGLKAASSNYLRCNLSPENLLDILLLADRHQDEDLKGHVIDYMVEQKYCLTEENWQSFMEQNTKLAAEIVSRVFQSK